MANDGFARLGDVLPESLRAKFGLSKPKPVDAELRGASEDTREELSNAVDLEDDENPFGEDELTNPGYGWTPGPRQAKLARYHEEEYLKGAKDLRRGKGVKFTDQKELKPTPRTSS